ncbi:unnamed protein product [Lupinus luteus]|uniref:Bifunctional inhibitor/plant lipid transfer protein/seed storage helical domain-containing protein n=1 Tax=Lupinus luteus TaxID=3873 RepID=A0AAV1WUB8_LUPLU
MASNAALLLSLNILFFTVVSSTYVPCPPPPTPKHSSPPTPKHSSPPTPTHSSPPTPKHSSPPTPTHSSPPTPTHSSPPTPKHSPSPKAPSPTPKQSPSPKAPSPSPTKQPSCPNDILKFDVCADVLGLVNVQLGKSSKDQCCSLIDGLSNLDAAVCLCTALKANVLGINLNVPINLSLILNYCGKDVPNGFQCN